MHEAVLVFNTVFFWRTGPRFVGPLFLLCVLGTALDFAMHFVIELA
jgi:hypothetical protein